MCGIFGHVGGDNSITKCIKGLKLLEYRGYDSAGIAGVHEGELYCIKEPGKISQLEKVLNNTLVPLQSTIGHTRWATHGEATKVNAHPHFDQKGDIALVHNGILENYQSLRAMLKAEGVLFESDTDTEVIVQLIAHFYKGNLVEALQSALSLMKGFWGIALIHKNHPNNIFATTRENPIAIGMSKNQQEAFISSDPYAFSSSKNLDLYFLKNNEIAVIAKDKIEIFNEDKEVIEKTPEYFEYEAIEHSKGDFEHYMLKEIFEQPQTIRSAMHNRFMQKEALIDFENLQLSKEALKKVSRIIILGCGTSWHAGCIAAMQFEALSEIPSTAEIASEFRYKTPLLDKDTLVITISQSGETLDTIAAMRLAKEHGAKVIAICNVAGSTLVREADSTILLRAGPEISVCSTKAFTSQLTVLFLLALHLSRLRGMSKERAKFFLDHLLSLPHLIEDILARKNSISTLAKTYSSFSNFFFLGRQYMYPTSLEAALKLKEISYLNANGYPAGELKHGSIALIDTNSVVIGMCGNAKTYEKTLSNLTEVKARGAHVIVIAPEGSKDLNTLTRSILLLPPVCDELASIPYCVASQLLAYYIAKENHTDIDQPRNLAKSVTVE